jgi:hypothetical protein
MKRNVRSEINRMDRIDRMEKDLKSTEPALILTISVHPV